MRVPPVAHPRSPYALLPFDLLFVCSFRDPVFLFLFIFFKMRLPFESEGAAKLNRDIFETIYFGAVEASVKVRGRW